MDMMHHDLLQQSRMCIVRFWGARNLNPICLDSFKLKFSATSPGNQLFQLLHLTWHHLCYLPEVNSDCFQTYHSRHVSQTAHRCNCHHFLGALPYRYIAIAMKKNQHVPHHHRQHLNQETGKKIHHPRHLHHHKTLRMSHRSVKLQRHHPCHLHHHHHGNDYDDDLSQLAENLPPRCRSW